MTNLFNTHRTALLLATILTVPRAVVGQDVLTDPVPLGAMERVGLLDQLPFQPKLGFVEGTSQLIFSPTFVGAQGANVYGVAIGFVSRGALPVWPFQLTASAKNVSVGSLNHFRYGADLKIALLPDQKAIKASLRASYQNTTNTSTREDFVLSADRVVVKGRVDSISIGGSGAYISSSPVTGSTVHSGKATVGSTVYFGKTTQVILGYSFNNKIDKKDDSSLTLSQVLTGFTLTPTIALVAGKGRVIALNLILAF